MAQQIDNAVAALNQAIKHAEEDKSVPAELITAVGECRSKLAARYNVEPPLPRAELARQAVPDIYSYAALYAMPAIQEGAAAHLVYGIQERLHDLSDAYSNSRQ